MTMQYRGRAIAVECDDVHCNDEAEGESGERWESLWPRLKREGWSTRRIGDRNAEWMHACPKHRV